MKALQGVTLTARELEIAYSAVLYFTEGLIQYKSWVQDRKGVPLPGMETAVAQMDVEIAEIQALQLRMFSAGYNASS